MVSRPWGWPALNYVMPTMSQSLGIAPPFLQLAVPKAPPEWTDQGERRCGVPRRWPAPKDNPLRLRLPACARLICSGGTRRPAGDVEKAHPQRRTGADLSEHMDAADS